MSTLDDKIFDNPLVDRPHPAAGEGGSGFQKLYRFDNGYGASVVRFRLSSMFSSLGYGSYTYNEDEFELAVIQYTGKDVDDFRITYQTPITDDVLGHLTLDEVEKTLAQIKNLPKPKKAKQ